MPLPCAGLAGATGPSLSSRLLSALYGPFILAGPLVLVSPRVLERPHRHVPGVQCLERDGWIDQVACARKRRCQKNTTVPITPAVMGSRGTHGDSGNAWPG